MAHSIRGFDLALAVTSHVDWLGCGLHPQPKLQSFKLYERTRQEASNAWVSLLAHCIACNKALHGKRMTVDFRVFHWLRM
jgi:hypothetical protein